MVPIVNQIKQLESLYENLFSQKIYWLKKLSGELPETTLIGDYVRPLVCNVKNKQVTFELSSEFSKAIFKLSKKSELSIYLVLLTAAKILLYKYTGNRDLIVGSPVYNPSKNDSLINQVAIVRSALANEMTFKEFLLQVKDTAIAAYSHQNYPFTQLIRLLKLPPTENRSPIFDVAVLLENIHDASTFGDMGNDLTIAWKVKDHQLQGKIEYSELLFKEETIQRLALHYVNLLKNALDNIHTKISDICLLNTSEKIQLLEAFNDNTREYPVHKTLHELFENQVDKTPNKIAVVFEGTQLTYRELNEKANQLANLLQSLGVKNREFIGILQQRSPNFLISIIAILKAGGAYVPIDSTYPPERIRYMLSHSEVRILLTHSLFLEGLTSQIEDCPHLKYLICLDVNLNQKTVVFPCDIKIYNRHNFEKLPTTNLPTSNYGIDPAYAIYTSGSTGLPKGAIIRHGGAINHIYAQFEALSLSEELAFLQSAPASSDISIWQFLAPLLIGGKTAIANLDIVCNPEKLFQLIHHQKITIVELVPTVVRGLIDYLSQLSPQQRALPDLKWMMVTGESVSVELANQWLNLYPSISIVNAYGPTEAADDITQAIIEKPLQKNQRLLPIGKPLANLNLYILDSQMKLVPIGVPGEICVSGFGVGEGYWKDEQNTALSFVSNPFPNTAKPLPGLDKDLIYKTGDLGRWLPEGMLEFLGRIDRQVKIRGFRIELGEIEAVLERHPAVQETVVTVREDSLGNKRLVAYVVPQRSKGSLIEAQSLIITDELRDDLKQKLPEYMMPSAFVLLEGLPLLPNGKIDRRSLPDPEKSAIATVRSPVEEMVASIWGEILGVEYIGSDDNFFDLGGHSLLATQAIARLRAAFQIELPLRVLFEAPTVASLSDRVSQACHSPLKLETPPIERVSREGELPLSFAQQRLWFLDQLQPGNPAYNIPAAVRLKGILNLEVLERSFQEIINRHEALRTTFNTVEGRPIQVITPSFTFTLSVVDLRNFHQSEREAKALQLVSEEARKPFILAKLPLIRVTLLQLAETEYILLLTIHHIIADGWSLGIIVREMATIYEAFSTGKSSPLSELKLQYVDYTVWQRKWLQGEVLEEKLSYWKQQLGNNYSALKLPTKQVTAATSTYEAAIQPFALSPHLSAALKKLSRQQNVTLFMTLLAALETLLYRYTNQDDITIGTDLANRTQFETEALIGFFVNILLLRNDLSGNPTFCELLERVREVSLKAYAYQDLPFDKLVEELRPNRTLNQTPLFQVLFVLQNMPIPALQLAGLSLTPLEIDSGIAKFDLVLFMGETEQGIVGRWKYNSDLFDASAIEQMSSRFETLLNSIVAQPDTRLNNLEIIAEVEKQKQSMQELKREKLSFNKFKNVKPKVVALSDCELIKTDYLQSGELLPLLIKPAVTDVDLIDWAKNNREFIESKLLQHGAILFRGFTEPLVSTFEQFAHVICPQLFGEYGDLPREGISEKVYGSTPYPADKTILFHNESSHLHCWPLKIWFFCVQPAQQGGETPIVDCRKIYQLLPPKLREIFAQKQLMYVRNYTDGLDVSWQEFFKTADKTEVEKYCRHAKIDFEWKEGNRLIARKVRPAIVQHPITNEMVFFNQLFLHHISCLDPAVRASLLSVFGEENLPRNVYYGDGSPIEDLVIEEIQAIYQQATISFPWEAGDILILDNMSVAHSRNPFLGARKIVVAMGEMIGEAEIEKLTC
ncbi:amino acid adenylation domain-containing protein [Kamptonema animale CS-326]|jgi:amino acid adenylation domain-containing protein|uniref:non-ribosomal peptide synthetase n=1 Tax=Kamptonema animale TaxID=92934 RepID=UPI00232B8ADE|nr:non-ribosomal peptide synthetase [Kamptonema animale]MDB9510445.1 amino acid adenylation domain-containing protein [Kamptonema animale CS-326]